MEDEEVRDGATSNGNRVPPADNLPEHLNSNEERCEHSLPDSQTYKSSSEYAAAVNQWLWQCYYWQCFVSTLPFWAVQSVYHNQSNTGTGTGTTDFNRNFPNSFFPNQNLFLPGSVGTQPHFQGQPRPGVELSQGREFIIPSVWKRLAAEVIDFFILLVLKVMITYIAVDFFDLINLDKYDFDMLKNDKMDYRRAMEVTSEIITLEIIHRFVVCIFEALCLHRGVVGTGGSTPGKSVMKLKVVSCHSVIPLAVNRVRVYPAGDIGIGWALLRAFIKNFSLAFVFPICFTMFFFQHNRTAYDIICSSIVVEELPRGIRRN